VLFAVLAGDRHYRHDIIGLSATMLRGNSISHSCDELRRQLDDLPPSDGAKGKLGIADLKEGHDAAEEAFG
jgi:hypothetical protein